MNTICKSNRKLSKEVYKSQYTVNGQIKQQILDVENTRRNDRDDVENIPGKQEQAMKDIICNIRKVKNQLLLFLCVAHSVPGGVEVEGKVYKS